MPRCRWRCRNQTSVNLITLHDQAVVRKFDDIASNIAATELVTILWSVFSNTQ
jgi:hypothetical protein